LLLYYITDRSQFPGDESSRQRILLAKIAEAAKLGVDFIQLREKDLSARDLLVLAQKALHIIRETPVSATRLLINSRTDVAIAAATHGVHLRSVDVSPADVREIWSRNARPSQGRLVISVACHTIADVALAAENQANLALFGPVFEKINAFPSAPEIIPPGLPLLKEACRQKIPVIALGGVTPQNVRACVDAGAAGIAGIRLFQENEIRQVVRQLQP
jgi:thiamine-phosphate pyrophosphorylase